MGEHIGGFRSTYCQRVLDTALNTVVGFALLNALDEVLHCARHNVDDDASGNNLTNARVNRLSDGRCT